MELCLKITQRWRAGSKKWATKDVEGERRTGKGRWIQPACSTYMCGKGMKPITLYNCGF